jgi:uncharacterized membrane protein YeiH
MAAAVQPDILGSALGLFEAVGTIAFAASGIIEAARKKFDIFGIVLTAFVTAFGGGTLRDILLDRRPFFWESHQEWIWIMIALGFASQLFFKARHIEFSARAMLWPDAIGLGLFATLGAQIALDGGSTPVVAAIMGVITAAFGGVIRDILINEIPRAVNDYQPYAVVGFGGVWVMWGLEQVGVASVIAVSVSAALIIAIRLASVAFNWKLPSWRL